MFYTYIQFRRDFILILLASLTLHYGHWWNVQYVNEGMEKKMRSVNTLRSNDFFHEYENNTSVSSLIVCIHNYRYIQLKVVFVVKEL